MTEATMRDPTSARDVLTRTETNTIITGFITSRKSHSASDAELRAVLARVAELRLNGRMADLICQGAITVVEWDGEDIATDRSVQDVIRRRVRQL
jgi:hypothetical protein